MNADTEAVRLRTRIFVAVLTLLLLGAVSGGTVFAGNGGEEDVGATLFHHILDGHDWKVLPGLPTMHLHDLHIGPVTVPVTIHVLMLLLNSVLLCLVFITAFRRERLVPSRLASVIEPLVFFVRDSLVYPAMGEEMGRKWLWFFYTMFFFILGANIIGMIPLFKTATGNLSITSAMAVMVFFIIVINGFRKLGFIGFFKAMIPEGLPPPIAALLFVIDFANLFIRSGVLSIRLFANMIAGHLVISSILLLAFIIHPLVISLSVPMALFISLLEVLVAVIQAIVFTMLSAVFIKMACSHH